MNALREWLTARPWWVTAIGLFCAYMTLIYVPFDLFWKPVAEDQEVWFGIVLHGRWAKATEPLHWAIYAAGTWGFLRERPWIWVASSLYVGQIAIGMLVWSVTLRRNLRGARDPSMATAPARPGKLEAGRASTLA
jgi:hypothetical protein